MLVKALRSFKGRYGHIRAGMQFNCAPGYYEALVKKGWVEVVAAESVPKGPGPKDNRSIPGAPARGNVPAAPNKGGGSSRSVKVVNTGRRPGKTTAARPGAGKGRTSRSLRQDLPSSGATSSESGSGATTPEAPGSDDPSGE